MELSPERDVYARGRGGGRARLRAAVVRRRWRLRVRGVRERPLLRRGRRLRRGRHVRL